MLLFLTACLALWQAPPRCPSSCDPWSCDATGACLDTCMFDDDCAAGAVCGDAGCVAQCVEDECPGGYACEFDLSACKDHCIVDDDCQAGRVCADGACEPPCADADCPGGYACDPFANSCRDDCMGLDSYCQSGFHCCSWDDAGCDVDDECVRD